MLLGLSRLFLKERYDAKSKKRHEGFMLLEKGIALKISLKKSTSIRKKSNHNIKNNFTEYRNLKCQREKPGNFDGKILCCLKGSFECYLKRFQKEVLNDAE